MRSLHKVALALVLLCCGLADAQQAAQQSMQQPAQQAAISGTLT